MSNRELIKNVIIKTLPVMAGYLTKLIRLCVTARAQKALISINTGF